jgi:comEA protein
MKLRKLGFTPNEQKVIYFLLITLCIGGGIKLYYGIIGNMPLPRFDYTATDREFEGKHFSRSGVDSANINQIMPLRDYSNPHFYGFQKKALPHGNLNLNAITKSELLSLPGIGETTAERIILYRKEHGGFTSNEELMKVKGIGKKKFLKLKPYLRQP